MDDVVDTTELDVINKKLAASNKRVEELSKQLDDANKKIEEYTAALNKIGSEIETVHQMLDVVPNSISRITGSGQQLQIVSLITRLSAWLGVR